MQLTSGWCGAEAQSQNGQHSLCASILRFLLPSLSPALTRSLSGRLRPGGLGLCTRNMLWASGGRNTSAVASVGEREGGTVCCTPSKALCHATLVCTPDTCMCVDYNIRQFVLAHHTMKMFLNLFTRKDCTLQVV